MKVKTLMNEAEFQTAIHFVWYDYDTDTLHEISEEEANDYEIKYIYTENDEIVIEVDKED